MLKFLWNHIRALLRGPNHYGTDHSLFWILKLDSVRYYIPPSWCPSCDCFLVSHEPPRCPPLSPFLCFSSCYASNDMSFSSSTLESVKASTSLSRFHPLLSNTPSSYSNAIPLRAPILCRDLCQFSELVLMKFSSIWRRPNIIPKTKIYANIFVRMKKEKTQILGHLNGNTYSSSPSSG